MLPLKRTEKRQIGSSAEGAGAAPIHIHMANITHPDLIQSYLASADGQNAVLNVISAKSGAVRRVLKK